MKNQEIILLGPAYNVNRPQQRLRTKFAEASATPVTITHVEDPKDPRVCSATLVIVFHQQMMEQLSKVDGQETLLWSEPSQKTGIYYQDMMEKIDQIIKS